MKFFRIHPITRKRLQRFRKVEYAYNSFLLLVFFYLLSLIAEVLCNNRPLMVRYEGKTYFPFVKFYPEDTFTGSGRMTRPDYKQINRSEAFRSNPENFMHFAPVPYGPRETVTAEEIETSRLITVEFEAKPSTAVVYLRPDLTIDKLRDSTLPIGLALDENLAARMALNELFQAAFQKRVNNEADEIYEQDVVLGEKRLHLKMVANKVRSKPRDTVRLYLNEAQLELGSMTWGEKGWRKVDPNWETLPLELREQIEAGALAARSGEVAPLSFEVENTPYTVSFSKEQVTFPFRPCKGHWLGLDEAGRDVLTLLLYGMRVAFSFGIILVLVAMVFGTLIGAAQGYYAGKVDLIAQRLIEIWQAMPFLYIIILVGSVFGRSFLLLLVIYGIFNWIGISYYMRAEFLKLRSMPYVEASRCMGVRPIKIMFKHMLPNALVPLVTFFPFSLVGAIGALTALDYLGFGLPAGTASWGALLSQAQTYRFAWWLIVYPSLALFGVMLLGVFVGEGVRTAFDPRQYSRMEG